MENFLDIVNLIACEKGLREEEVQSVVKDTMVDVAKSLHGSDLNYSAEIDNDKRSIKVFQKIEILSNEDYRLEDSDNFISISKSKEIDGDLQIGDSLEYEIDLEQYGRTAPSNFYYKLENNIQRLIEKNLYEKFSSKQGKIVSGIVVFVDENQNTFVEIDEVRAMLSMKNRIKDESFKKGEIVQAILKHIKIDNRGIYIELSRTTPKFLEELLSLEVPEIKDGSIEIIECARIPGKRAKIALISLQPNVDAIGCVVGVKGVRINSVSAILNNENIDCIEYSTRREIFISRALSPAIVSNVVLSEKDEDTAIVTVNSLQKAKAIGKAGVNIRLASMLTKTNIQIVEDNKQEIEQIESKIDVSKLESLFKE